MELDASSEEEGGSGDDVEEQHGEEKFDNNRVKQNDRVCFLEGKQGKRTTKVGTIVETRKDGWNVLFDGEVKPRTKKFHMAVGWEPRG